MSILYIEYLYTISDVCHLLNINYHQYVLMY